MRFKSAGGEIIEVLEEFVGAVKLRNHTSVTLFWVKKGAAYCAYQVTRTTKGKVKGKVMGSVWQDAKREFLQLIHRSAVHTTPTTVHTLRLYITPTRKAYKCLAVCHEGRRSVETQHKYKIGAVGAVFRLMNKECGCKHRKKYDELADYYVGERSTDPEQHDSRHAHRTVGAL